ncbi:MAG: glucose-1-phosphate thymidylyltransferase [Patescibacteria group bacterium]
MKALLTAGGRATRLRPVTHTINKHLIPLANKPMLFHALEKIAETGITEVGININEDEKEIQRVVGDGAQWGLRITYIEQRGGALGLAHIIKNAKDVGFLNGPFLMYLGDNIILGSIRRFVERFQNENLNCMLALSRVKDPERFGVPEMDVHGRIVRVVEKPLVPMSQFAITGIYLYDHHALEAVERIKPSARGEMEITDVHQYYLDNGLTVGYEEISGWWKDTGKPEDLLEGNLLILNDMPAAAFRVETRVPDTARLQGKVSIGLGTRIDGNVLIRGPVVIGRNCQIINSYIGPYASIGDNGTVANTEIEHSIIMEGASISCGTRVVDSIIGANARLVPANQSLPVGHKMVIGDNTYLEM